MNLILPADQRVREPSRPSARGPENAGGSDEPAVHQRRKRVEDGQEWGDERSPCVDTRDGEPRSADQLGELTMAKVAEAMAPGMRAQESEEQMVGRRGDRETAVSPEEDTRLAEDGGGVRDVRQHAYERDPVERGRGKGQRGGIGADEMRAGGHCGRAAQT